MKHYFALWLLLAIAIIALASKHVYFSKDNGEKTLPIVEQKDVPVKTLNEPKVVKRDSMVILLIGDSMLEGLSPRLAQYARSNGHQLHTVIHYGSTAAQWAENENLSTYVEKYHPDYVMICLGANELFIRQADSQKRDIEKIVARLGAIPYLWISAPHHSSGINEMAQRVVPADAFFNSESLTLQRAKDKIHPTRRAAAEWTDSIVSWLNSHSLVSPQFSLPPVSEKVKATSIDLISPDK